MHLRIVRGACRALLIVMVSGWAAGQQGQNPPAPPPQQPPPSQPPSQPPKQPPRPPTTPQPTAPSRGRVNPWEDFDRPRTFGGVVKWRGKSREQPLRVTVTLKAIGRAYEQSAPVMVGGVGGRFSFASLPRASRFLLTIAIEDCQTCESSEVSLDEWAIEQGSLTVWIDPVMGVGGTHVVGVKTLQVPRAAVEEWRRAWEEEGRNQGTKAISHYQKALELHPNFTEAFHGLARVYSRNGQNADAEATLLKALAADPNDSLALRNLGYTCLITKREARSVDYLKKAAELAPEDALTWGFLGEALFQTGQSQEAETALKRAVELDPASYRANYRLGHIYLQSGRGPDALSAFRSFLKHNKGMDPAQVKRLVAGLEKQQGPGAGK